MAMFACTRAPRPRYAPPPLRDKDLPTRAAELMDEADRLVRERPKDLVALDRARIALQRALLAKADRFAVHWRLARVCFLMTQRLENREQRAEHAIRGMGYAQEAVKLQDERVEGHYYLALNMAKLAQAKSKLRLVKRMVRVAQRAAEIDPRYDEAGPLVFLGKVYLTAPAWPLSVGDVDKAIEMLERAVKLVPRPLTRVFLGQAYYEDDRDDQARQQIERALKDAKPGEIEPHWREEAKKILAEVAPDR